MTEVSSPSSRKVDDFLSSLSQLSQERLNEDRQRQRDLQKNIDELQSRSQNNSSTYKSQKHLGNSTRSSYQLDIPDLKFNRNKLKNDDDEEPPKLPRRKDDTPPTLPKRKSDQPPTLPKRKPDLNSIGLLQPISRKDTSLKPEKLHTPVKPTKLKTPEKPTNLKTPEKPTNFRAGSFRDMEQRIKSGDSNTVSLENALKPTKLSESTSKPITKPKPKHLQEEPEFLSKFQQLKTSKRDPPQLKPKPKPPVSEAIDFKTSLKPLKPASKPKSETLEFQTKLKEIESPNKKPQLITTKSSKFKSDYEEKDSEELRIQLQKMAAKKNEKQLTPEIKEEKKSAIKPETKDKSKTIPTTPEMKKIKTTPEKKPKPPIKPLKKASSNLENSVNLSFEDKLGAILSRSQTFPQSASSTTASDTLTTTKFKNKSTSELTHVTKTRAKGPKRKLPKNLNKQQQPKETLVSKKPPPIKQKPKEIKVKPRVISGEVFI
ncbi:hypothetical protein KGF54_002207 [Candida jiufengensis]|uniref:uncharacterized protein n=1 Tax=Candida jiufengensis TaxID=497108 RepID=UPI002225A255|nr:uncharacterized protein KGF54_002207 [Candida jiufengensis]KAI5954432.1 hypothetical protein KGF54_002207 [Candida jiufengensis]